MKIRHKVTIWIASTALLAALGFSSYIFSELIEEPLRLIDTELALIGEAIFVQIDPSAKEDCGLDRHALPYSPDSYWIRVENAEGKVLYQSALAAFTEIPPNTHHGRRYNVEVVVPRDKMYLNQHDDDCVVFRVRTYKREINGQWVSMRIAKPVEDLEEELIVVIKEALLGIVVFVGLIIWVSYYLTGRILEPVVSMTRLAAKISEDSLEQRIEPGENNDELATLAHALNRMLDGLQHSFDRQRAFLSNGSHELKSPLTRLILTQEQLLLEEDLPRTLQDDLQRQLSTMHWMKKLVQSLLNLSRLEQEESLVLADVNLNQLLLEVIDNYQEMLSSTGIRLHVDLDDDLLIQGDRLHLQRLLINLVDNAIRYNDSEDGKLTIKAHTRDSSCIIDIDNAGQQISAAEHGLIFEQFYRVEQSRSMLHGGVGLGLTMCKKIVDLHNGRIVVQNGLLGGTSFRIILPC